MWLKIIKVLKGFGRQRNVNRCNVNIFNVNRCQMFKKRKTITNFFVKEKKIFIDILGCFVFYWFVYPCSAYCFLEGFLGILVFVWHKPPLIRRKIIRNEVFFILATSNFRLVESRFLKYGAIYNFHGPLMVWDSGIRLR